MVDDGICRFKGKITLTRLSRCSTDLSVPLLFGCYEGVGEFLGRDLLLRSLEREEVFKKWSRVRFPKGIS